MRANAQDYFESAKFLKAEDLPKREVTVTVEKFEAVPTQIGKRPLLRLKGYDLPLGLNATNFKKMVEKYGEETNDWEGRKITLYKIKTTNPQNHSEVDGIRIK